ncbi:tetratricopeptide repeat protein 32 isoform X2 [Ictalurus punctatus]|uniref:Tetratricopeptide repeat protein 32 isoform X2 n=1 Tax=Ictalurus punctatus TaxID=7998 RepID=A0A2D0Q2W6_ICTPU|nr:tetratricopeptide repeat protein 32 isoform X2 [Ictalurus punctatus]
MEDHREVLDRQTLLNEANNEFNSHHWKRAEDLYTEFIDICMASGECDRNDLAIAYNNRGQVKYFRVDFYEAVDDYSAAIKANRQFEVAYYNRGLIRYRLASSQTAGCPKSLHTLGDCVWQHHVGRPSVSGRSWTITSSRSVRNISSLCEFVNRFGDSDVRDVVAVFPVHRDLPAVSFKMPRAILRKHWR